MESKDIVSEGLGLAADAGPKRLMIKEMVLHNFKSYAGEKTIGPFHKSFSSVVGPNGSGKSNVIDALLFVFGSRASKIRLKKISELIHRSSQFPALEKCSVSVRFHDIIDDVTSADGYTVVPDSEVTVTRTADKAGTSNYYLNGKKSSFTLVTTFLKGKGIDLNNNRFLILQGEVEQIAMMKPKAQNEHDTGLLEYLEDIVGSNGFIDAIEESAEELEKMTELRQVKLNRVKLVEKEKLGLEGAKSEAEEYLAIRHKQFLRQAQLFQIKKAKAEGTFGVSNEKLQALQVTVDAERAELTAATAKLAILEGQFETKKTDFEATSKAMEAHNAEFNAIERKDIQCREDMKHQKAKAAKLATKIKAAEKKLGQIAQEAVSKEEFAVKIEKDIVAVTNNKDQEQKVLDDIFDALKGKTAHLRVAMESKQKELIPLQKVVNEAEQQVNVVQSELTMLQEKQQKHISEQEKSVSLLKSLQKEVKANAQNTMKAQKALETCTASFTEAQANLKNTVAEFTECKAQRQALLGKNEEIKVFLQKSKAAGAVLSGLMKANKAGRLNGVKTRLGNLGSIDKKYDVAISTVCGALNNVVVDSTANGRKCVEYLRRQHLGMATFILLDQIEKTVPTIKNIQTPENVPRLFDLVQTEAQYKKAFYFALRDTLVAKDLTQAVRIGMSGGKRWRVVTLNGELVDTSGAMSGGGNKSKSGLMTITGSSTKVNQRASSGSADYSMSDLKECQREVAMLQNTMLTLQDDKKSLTARVKTLTTALKKAEMTFKKLAMAFEGLEKQEADQQAVVDRLSNTAAISPAEQKRVGVLTQKVEQYQTQHNAALANTAALEAEITSLESEIMDAGGAKLRVQKAKLDKFTTDLSEMSKSLTKIQVWMTNKVKREAKLAVEIKTSTTEIDTCATTIEDLKKESANIEEVAGAVMIKYQAAEQLLAERTEELSEIQTTYEENKSTVDKLTLAEDKLSNSLEDLKKDVAAKLKNVQHFSKLLTTVVEKITEATTVTETKEAEAEAATETVEEPEETKLALTGKVTLAPYVAMTEEELEDASEDDISYAITMLEKQMSALSPNMAAIAEYYQKEKEYLARVAQLDGTTSARDKARQEYDNLRKQRLDAFMTGFSLISMKLKEMYQMLTLGGDAELELVDSLDPFSEGVVFSVRPPKKSWKNIQNLSGGEKTLSSLALVFALHHYKPTPLYVMDEIDAALDFKNVSIVANYIKERTKNAQFIIISLRNNMFELADRLVGIYKTNDQTKSITIDPSQFSKPATAPVNNNTKAAAVVEANNENANPQTNQ